MRNSYSRKTARMQTLGACLAQSSDWARVAAHAERLLRLQQIYARVAPDNLAASSQVANYKVGKVVIHASNGAVAAKLKQMALRLADEFCKKGCEVTEVVVRVQVAPQQSSPPVRAPRSISGEALSRIERFAATLGDTPLAETMRRLARISRKA